MKNVGRILLFGSLVLALIIPKAQMSFWINSIQSNALSWLMRYGTHIGDGRFSIGLFLLLLFKNRRRALFFLLCFLSTVLVVQGLKHLVFFNFERPYLELWDSIKNGEIHLVLPENMMRKVNSFPSGHTATAFCSWVAMWYIFNRRKVVFFVGGILAIMVGFSRVYLLQHFFIDVVFGAFIGILMSMLCRWFFDVKNLNIQ